MRKGCGLVMLDDVSMVLYSSMITIVICSVCHHLTKISHVCIAANMFHLSSAIRKFDRVLTLCLVISLALRMVMNISRVGVSNMVGEMVTCRHLKDISNKSGLHCVSVFRLLTSYTSFG